MIIRVSVISKVSLNHGLGVLGFLQAGIGRRGSRGDQIEAGKLPGS